MIQFVVFKDQNKKTIPKLSTWKEKDFGEERSKITWSVIDRVPALRNGTQTCNLFWMEKYSIIFQPGQKINKRNETVEMPA